MVLETAAFRMIQGENTMSTHDSFTSCPVRRLLVLLAGLGGSVAAADLMSLDAASPLRHPVAVAVAEAGALIKDCERCPEMRVIPAGAFLMGSREQESEGPLRSVRVSAFALARTEVTFAQWDACVADGGCNGYRPDDAGWGRADRPVTHVSWNDAQAYVRWLSRATGKSYRLPSEAEWEYAARAGTTTAFYTGDCIHTDQANYDGTSDYKLCGARTGLKRTGTMPVGSFPANPFGLHDMAGNVWEWVEDCWHGNHAGAPSDSRPRTLEKCAQRVLRGGAWYSKPVDVRAAMRGWEYAVFRLEGDGFRIARDLDE